jgi:general secretion pathway protein J
MKTPEPMKRPETGNQEGDSGFTLLELIVSMTILAIIVTVVFSSLRIGSRAWEKGEADIRDNQRLRVVSDLIRRQISSARQCRVYGKSQKKLPFYFKGYPDGLKFVSALSLQYDNPYPYVQVTYLAKASNDGMFGFIAKEDDIILPGVFVSEENRKKYDVIDTRLLSGLQTLSFSYLEITDGQFLWRNHWDAGVREKLPEAVRIVLKPKSIAEPVTIIAQIGESFSPPS